jgi:hypothetical protein
MTQTALLQEMFEARLGTGKVLHSGATDFRIVSGNVAHDASLAASCLMQPQQGDTVLLAFLENGLCAILAILFRNETAQACLRLPSSSSLECPGTLAVCALAGLELQSGGTLSLESEKLTAVANSGALHVAKVKTLSDTAEICCRSLTTLGHTALSVFRSLTQCLGASRRMVEGNDEVQAGNSTLVVAENATVMSKNGLTLAEETSRTDAKLIQLG